MNHYIVLDVKPDATADEIKKAYRAAASKTHPDRGGMTHMFRMVQEAYETLSDPDKRTAYDREMGLAPTPQPVQDEGPADNMPSGDYAYEEPAPAQVVPSVPRAAWMKWLKVAWIVGVAALAGWWLFQGYELWTIVQAKNQFRLYTPQGVPAIAYAVLWAYGTLVASVAEDILHGAVVAGACSAIAGAFAFITATGAPDQWLPALGTGLALTAAIAITVRVAAARR
jgi:hypothetical protein